MNGIEVEIHKSLSFVNECEAIFIGSGIKTLEICENSEVIEILDSISNQKLIAAQCSGSYILHKLGLINSNTISTDQKTARKLNDSGVNISNLPISIYGNIATAGGCLASAHLSGWVIYRLFGLDQARSALGYVAPAGDEKSFIDEIVRLIV